MKNCQKLKSGLIIHTGAIGDCLLTLPLAARLKELCALDRLDFIGPLDYIDFYPHRTCIDTVRSTESLPLHRFFKADFIETLAENDRLITALAPYEQIISFLGADSDCFETNLLYTTLSTCAAEATVIPAKPANDTDLHITEFYRHYFQQQHQLDDDVSLPKTTVTPLPEDYTAGADLLEETNIDPEKTIVIIQPGSGSREKSWHWENFIGVAELLTKNAVQPVFLLGPAEQERFIPQALDAVNRFIPLKNLTLTEVLQILTQADAFCGNDSGISHLSAAMGKKTLSLFGPASSPTHYAPRGPKTAIAQPPENSFTTPDSEQQQKIATQLLQIL